MFEISEYVCFERCWSILSLVKNWTLKLNLEATEDTCWAQSWVIIELYDNYFYKKTHKFRGNLFHKFSFLIYFVDFTVNIEFLSASVRKYF